MQICHKIIKNLFLVMHRLYHYFPFYLHEREIISWGLELRVNEDQRKMLYYCNEKFKEENAVWCQREICISYIHVCDVSLKNAFIRITFISVDSKLYSKFLFHFTKSEDIPKIINSHYNITGNTDKMQLSWFVVVQGFEIIRVFATMCSNVSCQVWSRTI